MTPVTITNRVSIPLVGLLLFLAAANLWWVYAGGGGPQHWDSAIHLSESLTANRVFDSSSGLSLRSLLNVSWYYPPFVSYASIPFYRVFGESEATGYIVETFFLLLLIASVFLLGSRLSGTGAGILAALIVAACPIVIEYSRVFMLDLPVAAMVALCVFLLIASDGFRHTWYGLAAGAALGFGELTKWTFFVFVISPLVFPVMQACRPGAERRRRLLTMLGAGALALLIAAPWYVVHIVQIITSRGGELARGNYTLLQSIFLYLHEIPGEASWLGAAILLAGIAAFFVMDRRNARFLAFWFVISYVLLSLSGIKAPRFAIPLLIPAALMAAMGIESLALRVRAGELPGEGLRKGIAIVMAVQIALVLFLPRQSPTGSFLSKQILEEPVLSVQGTNENGWNNTPALAVVAADMRRAGNDRAVVRVIPDHPYYNNSTAAYEAQLHRLPVQITGTSGFPMFTDYVITKSGDIGIDSPDRNRARLNATILGSAGSESSAFHLIDSVPLPDGSHALIVKVVPPKLPPAQAQRIVRAIRESAGTWAARYFRAAEGSTLDVDEYDSVHTAAGKIRSIRLKLKRGEFGDFAFNSRGIAVSDIDIQIGGLVIDPRGVLEEKTLNIFSIQSLRIRSFCIKASDIFAYLAASPSRDLEVRNISMANSVLAIDADIKHPHIPVSLAVGLTPAGESNIRFEFRSANVGRLPIPACLLNTLTQSYNPVIRGLEAVPDVKIGAVKVEQGELRIGPMDEGF